ncbi:hypothetical protein O9929_07860 [Vibrio lentus]|nr:hypothetical protein [Vibrio lentus]
MKVLKGTGALVYLKAFELGKVLLDEVRAGGRIPLIIGRGLTGRARDALGLAEAICLLSQSRPFCF